MPILSSTFARTTLGLMLGGVAVLIGIVLTSLWLSAKIDSLSDEVIRTRDIRIAATSLRAGLLDTETGQRGYLLTEDRRYLQPYEEARARLRADLTTLQERVNAGSNRAETVKALTALVDAKLAELAETIALAEAGNREKAVEIVKSDRGKAVMDKIRDLVDALVDRSEAIVTNRLTSLNGNAAMLQWVTIGGGALITIFALGAFWMVARYTRELIGARRQVEAANATLEARVAERTSALTRANEEVQRFAYIVSHDLRAPLVNIMGFTSELEVGTATLQKFVQAENPDADLAQAARTAATQDLPESVGFIRASTSKMDGLINAILRLSREGRRELKPQVIELGKLFAATTASVQHQVEETSARIEVAPDLPAIVSDRLALEQVFGNLLDNALKYQAPGRAAVIKIGSQGRGNRVQITVSDNGRGIAPQDHERIFELFRRSGTQDRPGEGIGLAHVRALVRRLGGDITVTSSLGEGTAFHVDLPRTLQQRVNEGGSLS